MTNKKSNLTSDTNNGSCKNDNAAKASAQKRKRVVVGMSGGVDSSVAAKVLLDSGYEVIGLFMNNWQEDDGNCTAASDWQDVLSVCAKLNIKCYSVNFAEKYLEGVFDYFLKEYRAFRTPNPDVLCNRVIKFGLFRDYALDVFDADYIATGHYCKVIESNPRCLYVPFDEDKDQTYFLNQVLSEQLDNVIFPLGDLKKSQVRQIAEQSGLSVAEKKDSTGVCFIGERNFKKFLMSYLPMQSGDIIEKSSRRVLGRHDGLAFYTLGQRRGLNIGGVQGAQGRWFVVEKDVKNNALIVSCDDVSALMTTTLETEDLNIIGDYTLVDGQNVFCKTRYRQSMQKAKLYLTEHGFKLVFDCEQRAVTAGQYAVIYVYDKVGDKTLMRCLGGGTIKSAR